MARPASVRARDRIPDEVMHSVGAAAKIVGQDTDNECKYDDSMDIFMLRCYIAFPFPFPSLPIR
jgi:hypothetical protein